MILIDPREGSKEILDYILAIPGHPSAEHSTMEYGDVAFTGEGPNGTMLIGLEVKTVGDALNCIESQRFTGHQLPGLKATYDASYLVIVGEYRADWDTGTLQMKSSKGNYWFDVKTGSRTWTHYEFNAWLTMVELGWGIRTRIVLDMKELARTIVEMYRVIQKPWEDHKTINPFYLGPTGNTPFIKPSLVERVVAQIDGIGPAKAREIGKRFGTVVDMVNSNPTISTPTAVGQALKRWKGIPGIGKQTATHIIEEFWGFTNQTKKEK